MPHDWNENFHPPVNNPTRDRSAKARRQAAAEYARHVKKLLAEANHNGRVFTTEQGNVQIKWCYVRGQGDLEPAPPTKDGTRGWREKPDGTRESVQWIYTYGWMSSDDIWNERQMFPRTAP